MLDILLIEDDPQYLMLVKRLLEDEGHTVRAAENGAKGLESYMQSPTTVVITDIFMPYKDGIEVIRAPVQTTAKTCRDRHVWRHSDNIGPKHSRSGANTGGSTDIV